MSFGDALAGFGKGVFNAGYEMLETKEDAERRAKATAMCQTIGMVARIGLIASAVLTGLALCFGGAVSLTLSLLVFVPFAILMSDANKLSSRVEALMNDHFKRVILQGDKRALWTEITQDTIILKHVHIQSN